MNYYQILQINNKASQEEIKKAYKRLSRKYHPDNAGEQGREMFEQIQKAYAILGDESKRENYDREQMGGRQIKKSRTEHTVPKSEGMKNQYKDLRTFYQGGYQNSFASFFGVK